MVFEIDLDAVDQLKLGLGTDPKYWQQTESSDSMGQCFVINLDDLDADVIHYIAMCSSIEESEECSLPTHDGSG